MKTVDREKLWGEYQKNPSSALREKLITEYAPLVKVVAGRLSMYLGYNVEYEDLVSYGIFGLIDAIDKFDPGKDVKFETYASRVSAVPFWIRSARWTGYQGLSDRSRSGLRKQSKISRRGRDVLRRMKRLLGRLELRRLN